jgi:Fe-S cluster biosynthesis and repair protein YggX|tara:strand:+ start:17015 stop:17305 length:291 start_codon:yes stop_codon:yes gene_type:complete
MNYNLHMSKKIFCKYYKRELDQMERPPYPGSLGERVYLNISKEAWDLWLEHQTMLINENRLSMVDPSARAYLQNEMIKFLFQGGSERPKEYIPLTE